jgi:tetratricopeptide (TPR) repeat protein
MKIDESKQTATREEEILKLEQKFATAPLEERSGILLQKAVLLGMQGRDAARTDIALAGELNPDDVETLFSHDYIDAVLYHEEQRVEEAFLRFTQFLPKYADLLNGLQRHIYEDVQQRRAYELLQLSQFQEAVDVSLECLNFDLPPNDRSGILSNLAVAYTELKDYGRAEGSFSSACELGLPKLWENKVHFYRGIALAHLKEFRDSKQQFMFAAKLSTNGGTIPCRSIYEWLAWVCKALGEKTEAEEYSRMAKPC